MNWSTAAAVTSVKEKLTGVNPAVDNYLAASEASRQLEELGEETSRELVRRLDWLGQARGILDRPAPKKKMTGLEARREERNLLAYFGLLQRLSKYQASLLRFVCADLITSFTSVDSEFGRLQKGLRNSVEKGLIQPLGDMANVLEQFRRQGYSQSLGVQMLNIFNVSCERMFRVCESILPSARADGPSGEAPVNFPLLRAALEAMLVRLKKYEATLGFTFS
eukprot:TRINITY_DN5648_c0_g2_i5.p1 TRINITY_DN5648_c0_g2~~TRINITY_DN5648_c0_g2_i5.p1  ORF type:complete len:222 (+),score=44.26 TRINITY_DN5648_c0_g2_i5:261-926(+)